MVRNCGYVNQPHSRCSLARCFHPKHKPRIIRQPTLRARQLLTLPPFDTPTLA